MDRAKACFLARWCFFDRLQEFAQQHKVGELGFYPFSMMSQWRQREHRIVTHFECLSTLVKWTVDATVQRIGTSVGVAVDCDMKVTGVRNVNEIGNEKHDSDDTVAHASPFLQQIRGFLRVESTLYVGCNTTTGWYASCCVFLEKERDVGRHESGRCTMLVRMAPRRVTVMTQQHMHVCFFFESSECLLSRVGRTVGGQLTSRN